MRLILQTVRDQRLPPCRRSRCAGNLALLISGLLAACGGGTGTGGGSSVNSTPPAVTVTISPTSASVVTGSGSVAFTAAVQNASETTVSWQVGGVAGGNQIVGTISASGVYSAPASPPIPASVTVTAVANADPTKTASATVSITQPPASLPSVPGGLTASSIATGSVALTWNASTDPAGSIAGYDVYRNGVRIAIITGATTYVDTPLTASTSYSYQVAAFDSATVPNVSALSPALVVTTLADTQAPTIPAGLSAAGITLASVTLSWGASTDLPTPGGTGVGGYNVYRNGVKIATVASVTSYTDSGLTASSSYSYQVAAFDLAATPNVSGLSTALSVMTLADTVPPTVPSALAATAVATGSVTLNWNASTDLPTPGATGVGGYYVYRNGATIATVTSGTSYADSPLTALTSYSYQVAAFDRATPPNVSAPSSSLVVRTLADTVAPTVPTGLSASGIGPCCATLHWNASTDLPNPGATGVGGYYVYRNGGMIATVTSGTSYSDATLAAESSYSYQVAAFDKAAPPNVSARSTSFNVNTGATLTLTPAHAALTLLQTQQFTANAPTGTVLTWSVDGTAGGSSTLGTISALGVYTPPASAGTHTVTATSSTDASVTGTAALAVTDLGSVATWHNDLARTGQNLQEYALTPATLASGNFGKRWSCPLDGTVYAQPLYVASVSIGGGIHNVLYVATMHDTVYAFDADSPACTTFWKLSLISPSAGNGISTQSNIPGCGDTPGEYGINGTPVIDPTSQTLYLVAATTENGTNVQRLHALNLGTGAEQANSPVVIHASVPGTGDGGTTVSFDPLYENQRPGLVLTGGGVVIGWASHCDITSPPYHGWMMRYDATLLTQTAVFNDTPNGTAGGIWMSGGAPAVDTAGNLFLSTGNGTFDDTSAALPALAPNNDFGESFLNLNSTTLAVTDFYTPSQNQAWTSDDLDISAGGVTVLPDGTGPAAHPNVMVGADKQGHFWMIDRSNMSGYAPAADNTVQYLTLPYQNGVYSGMAYWNDTVYASVTGGPLLALQLNAGLVPFSGRMAIAASHSAESYNFPNPTPQISASSSTVGAILWALDNNANGTDNGSSGIGPAILRAYDATNLGSTLYSSAARPADTCGTAAKFALPVVANGHVYVAGTGVLTVYGLSP